MTFQLLHLFSHVVYFLFVFLMQPFEHFNVIELYKLNIIIIIYYQYYICAQFVTNCLQSYNELHVCGTSGNLMYNTHSIGD